MLMCREATQLCSDEQERPLRLGEQIGLRTHLMMCSGCTNYRKHLQTIRQAMRAYAEGRAETDQPTSGESRGE